MSAGGWFECLTAAKTAGTSLATFTTAVTAIPAGARHTIAADDWDEGDIIRVKATGRVSNVVTAQPTFTFQFMLGTVATPIIAWTSGAVQCSTTVHTTVPWDLDVTLTTRSIGSGTSGTLMGIGVLTSRAFVDSGATADAASSHTSLMVPETTPAVGTGFDTNIANVADFFIACGTSNAGNLIQVEQYALFKTVRL